MYFSLQCILFADIFIILGVRFLMCPKIIFDLIYLTDMHLLDSYLVITFVFEVGGNLVLKILLKHISLMSLCDKYVHKIIIN